MVTEAGACEVVVLAEAGADDWLGLGAVVLAETTGGGAAVVGATGGALDCGGGAGGAGTEETWETCEA